MKLDADKMWEAWGRTNALYTAWCAAAGQNQYRVIVLYAIEAHAPITQKTIADYTGLSKQTVSTVMRTLKAEGLVSLRAGESDHREKKVYLTQKGTLYASEILTPAAHAGAAGVRHHGRGAHEANDGRHHPIQSCFRKRNGDTGR